MYLVEQDVHILANNTAIIVREILLIDSFVLGREDKNRNGSGVHMC